MGNGTYGTRRPANITSDDVDIFYHYRPSRSSEDPDFGTFKRLDSSLIIASKAVYNDTNNGTIELPGMYDLRLPLDKFGRKGIYTVYIKPKETFASVVDVGTLAAYPNIRGVVLNSEEGSEIFNNGNLVGYRIEYFESDGVTRNGEYRIITSNNKCEPVAQNFVNSSESGIKYIFNDSSSLVFCTVTPSVAMSFKSDTLPNIGMVGQKIALINTKFNPVSFEIEMVDHDEDTISAMLEGTQLRDLDHGLITTFTDDGGIYHQAMYGNIKNPYTGINHDFKIKKTDNIVTDEIDNLNEIKENL